MNIEAAISTLMTENLVTVAPLASLSEVKRLFEAKGIHHLPVVRYKSIVGIISQTDLNHFISLTAKDRGDHFIEAAKLRAWTVEEVMTKDLETVSPDEPIRKALELFAKNKFHAVPVVDGEELKGIVTTHDIINAILESKATLS